MGRYSKEPPRRHCRNHLSFDHVEGDRVLDLSPQSDDGDIVGEIETSTGFVGEGAYFRGDGTYVESQPTLDTDERTISAYYDPERTPDSNSVQICGSDDMWIEHSPNSSTIDCSVQLRGGVLWGSLSPTVERHRADISEFAGNCRGFDWGANGNKLYVVQDEPTDGTDAFVAQFSASDPYDVSSLTYEKKETFSMSHCDAIYVRDNGRELFVIDGLIDQVVYSYDMQEQWDVEDMSRTGSFDISSEVGGPRDLTFHPDGTYMYVGDLDTDSVYQYHLSTTWDVTTASYDTSVTVYDGDGYSRDVSGLTWSDDGSYLYVAAYLNSVLELSCSTSYDVSTASFSDEVSVEPDRPNGIRFDEDGLSFATAQDDGYLYDYASEGTTYSLSVETDLTNDDVHVVSRYEGGRLSVYVDGELADSKSIEERELFGASTFRVSSDVDFDKDTRSSVYGTVDEVRVYGDALSAEHVSQLYEIGSEHGADGEIASSWDNDGIPYRGNNQRLAEALSESDSVYQRELDYVLEARHIDTAAGRQLDRLGDYAGVQRKQNESDSRYRARIKATMASGRSDGTFQGIVEAVASILQTDIEDVRLETEFDIDPKTAYVYLLDEDLQDSDLTATDVNDVLQDVVISGHRIRVRKRGRNPFTLVDDQMTNDPELGLTADDMSIGGSLVEDV